MHASPDFTHKVGVPILDFVLANLLLQPLVNQIQFFLLDQIGDLSVVDQIVDVLQEVLTQYLVVVQQENYFVILNPTQAHHLEDVIPKVPPLIMPVDLNCH